MVNNNNNNNNDKEEEKNNKSTTTWITVLIIFIVVILVIVIISYLSKSKNTFFKPRYARHNARGVAKIRKKVPVKPTFMRRIDNTPRIRYPGY